MLAKLRWYVEQLPLLKQRLEELFGKRRYCMSKDLTIFPGQGRALSTALGAMNIVVPVKKVVHRIGGPYRRDRVPGGQSLDGKLVLTGSVDRTAILWDLNSGASLAVISLAMRLRSNPWHSALMAGMLLLAAGTTLAIVWDAVTCEKVKTLAGHTAWVRSVVFSPDNRYLATGSGDHRAMLWDIATGARVRSFDTGSNISAVIFSPDGKFLATGGMGQDSGALGERRVV
jgi:hypothetical protein